MESRIEQLKRTITSVVDAMNDPEYWGNINPEVMDRQKGLMIGGKISKKIDTVSL